MDTQETLINVMDMFNISNSDVEKLETIKFTNGTNIFNLTDSVEDRVSIYEICGLFVEGHATIESVDNKNSIEDLIWSQDIMDSGRNRVQREIDLATVQKVGVKGIGKCFNCSSEQLIYSEKQTRSGDEAKTVSVTCPMCNKSWKL